MHELTGYRIGDKLGEGAMAELRRVTAADGSRLVLKRPKLGFGSHPACYEGFEVERIILGRLAGPHVPRLAADGEDEAGPWLVMEEISGPSLAGSAAAAPLPAAEVARLGTAVASALHALHRQDVVHHDLKPSHVMFRPSGEAVLIDFGLACHGQLPDLLESAADGPLGTPSHLSPEQLAGHRGDPRSDIFALGVILYQLATGRLPFGAAAGPAGLRRRLYLDPAPPRRLRPEIPAWLQEIILGCLVVRTDKRYATAAQVAHDLAHPDQVVITARGRRTGGTPWRTLLRRAWLAHFGAPPPPAPPTRHLARAPHVLVALDTAPQQDVLARALMEAVRRLVAADSHWRVTCATVMDPLPAAGGESAEELARSQQTQHLMTLHHWAASIGLPPQQVRFAVLAGSDAAAVLTDYARRHHVDHLVMGARGSSALRRFLGSVSSRVVAEAPCTVTVVRAPMPDGNRR